MKDHRGELVKVGDEILVPCVITATVVNVHGVEEAYADIMTQSLSGGESHRLVLKSNQFQSCTVTAKVEDKEKVVEPEVITELSDFENEAMKGGI